MTVAWQAEGDRLETEMLEGVDAAAAREAEQHVSCLVVLLLRARVCRFCPWLVLHGLLLSGSTCVCVAV